MPVCSNCWRLTPLLLILTISASSTSADEGSFEVNPPHGQLRGSVGCIQLAVRQVATGRDRTRDVLYECLTPHVLTVSEQGRVRPVSNGDGIVRVSDGQQSKDISIVVSGIGTSMLTSFRNDVVPILNRAGCTGGSCHAAQYGQAGFKLSLWGFAPEEDYAPIVRQELGRRISLVAPDDSLILQKATMAVGHGGGRRFGTDSYEYEVLKTWLLDGAPAPATSDPVVVDLTVLPATRVYRSGDGQQLRVIATFSDGTTRDVTHSAMYDSMSESVATISSTGYVKAVGSGQTSVMVRHMGQAKVSTALVPHADSIDLADFQPSNFVDRLVAQRWQQLGLQPSATCSDEEFIRRVFLDALGTLPDPRRIHAFLESQEAGKRATLVEELLGLTGDPNRDVHLNEWSAYWALKWGDLLRNNRNKLGDGGMWALYNWTRASLRDNKPADQFVRELITAQGSVFQSGPANYYKVTTKPDELAEATAQNFLGVRMMCAKCHHHPFEVYSQADYYGLAAFFTRVTTKGSADFGALGRDTVVLVRRSGSIRHPRTRKTMEPTPLMGEPVSTDEHRDLRRPLAQWLTSPSNRLFARTW